MIRTHLKYLSILYVSFISLIGCINYTTTNDEGLESYESNKEVMNEEKFPLTSGYVDFRSGRKLAEICDTIQKENYLLQTVNRNNGFTTCYGDSNLHIIEYLGYEIVFNSLLKIPVLVKYELTAEEVDGIFSRKGLDFCEDSKACVDQANDYDYRGSGWSRGHMAPAGDFTWSSKALRETFYYTNCCPQDLTLNTGQWKYLEEEVRDWAKRFCRIDVVTGPIVGNNEYGTIGYNKVVIPDAFYKAIYNGEQAIAFVMYNRPKNKSMKNCAMSVDCLEELSGWDFFPELDDEIENKVEATYVLNHWNL